MSDAMTMLAFCACSSVSNEVARAGHAADPMAGGGISWMTLALLLLLALSLSAIHLLGCLALRQRNATPIHRIRGY